jgi:hypothetical protein
MLRAIPDTEIFVTYVRFSEDPVAYSTEVQNGLIFDYNCSDTIVGVEIHKHEDSVEVKKE